MEYRYIKVNIQAIILIFCRDLKEAEHLVSIGLEGAENIVLSGPVHVTEVEKGGKTNGS